MKNRIVMLLALAVLGVAASSFAGTAAAGNRVTVQQVTVLMLDYHFRLSKATVAPGKVKFTVINRGQAIHNWVLTGVHKMAFLAPGTRTTFTVTLKKGKFEYLCTVPRHAELGMTGTLTVK